MRRTRRPLELFSLVADDIAPLGRAAGAQLSADQQTLMESAQYFFGAGNARQKEARAPGDRAADGSATAQPHHARAESAAADADGEGSKWYGVPCSCGGDHRDDPHGVAGARRRPRRRRHAARRRGRPQALLEQGGRALGRLPPRARVGDARAPRARRGDAADGEARSRRSCRARSCSCRARPPRSASPSSTTSPSRTARRRRLMALLVQVGRAALGAPPRLRGGGRGREVRLPLRPRVPGRTSKTSRLDSVVPGDRRPARLHPRQLGPASRTSRSASRRRRCSTRRRSSRAHRADRAEVCAARRRRARRRPRLAISRPPAHEGARHLPRAGGGRRRVRVRGRARRRDGLIAGCHIVLSRSS